MMENNDDSQNHGIHLEKTYFGSEIMTSLLEPYNSLSDISLSFL